MIEVAGVLIGAAVFSLLAAAIGGGLKAGSFEFKERLTPPQRWGVSGLGVVFALAGGILLSQSSKPSTPSRPSTLPSTLGSMPALFGTAHLFLAPDSGPPGTAVKVTGTGFPVNSQLVVSLGLPGGDGIARVTTDKNGTLSGQFRIPSDAESRVIDVIVTKDLLPVATTNFAVT